MYLIVTGLDFLGAQKQVLESRFPYLEYPYPGLASLKKIPHPRMIKTHLPLSLLPPSAAENGAKVMNEMLCYMVKKLILYFNFYVGYIYSSQSQRCSGILLSFSSNGCLY